MLADHDDVQKTTYHAQEVFKSGIWSQAPALQRSMLLSNLARLLEENVPRLAKMESLQTGRAIREMNAQLARLPEWLYVHWNISATVLHDVFSVTIMQLYFVPTRTSLHLPRVNCSTTYSACLLAWLLRSQYVISPIGTFIWLIVIQPFNHPLFIAMKKIAPALAAGNSVIVKPSEMAPTSVLEFAEMAASVGSKSCSNFSPSFHLIIMFLVPPGVFSVLPGYGRTIGKALASDPFVRKVDITVRQLYSIGRVIVLNKLLGEYRSWPLTG